MRLFLFRVIGLIIIYGWAIQQNSEITKAEWLIGTWENKTSRGSVYETWTKISDNEFSGKSYARKEENTVVFETIRLTQKEGGLFYIPTVKNQNDGISVSFALKTISDTTLIFENAKHDFPQIISYYKISTDSLVAEISGTKNGQELKQTFPMKKVKSKRVDP